MFLRSVRTQAVSVAALCRPAPSVATVGRCRMISTGDVEVDKLFNPLMKDQKGRTNVAVHQTISEFQKHKSDTGSAAVQVMVATEKILNLTRHFLSHRKDKASYRGFQMLLSHRRSMLSYLKRSDVESYLRVTAAIDEITNNMKNDAASKLKVTITSVDKSGDK